MGDPKKLSKKYSTPVHPWNSVVIEKERDIKRNFSLKNKREIFKANSFLKKYKNLAKKLIANQGPQNEKEKGQMMNKLKGLGLISSEAIIDDILSLQIEDVLQRRLQSILFNKGLARSMKQSRQFITHRHVKIGDKEITTPAYLVSLEEENQITFKDNSPLVDEEHPERKALEKPVEVKEEKKTLSKKEDVKDIDDSEVAEE